MCSGGAASPRTAPAPNTVERSTVFVGLRRAPLAMDCNKAPRPTLAAGTAIGALKVGGGGAGGAGAAGIPDVYDSGAGGAGGGGGGGAKALVGAGDRVFDPRLSGLGDVGTTVPNKWAANF